MQTFSPVHVNVKESVGAAFLGLLSLVLLVALLRAEARSRALGAESKKLRASSQTAGQHEG